MQRKGERFEISACGEWEKVERRVMGESLGTAEEITFYCDSSLNYEIFLYQFSVNLVSEMEMKA